jgi:hypothetical protein
MVVMLFAYKVEVAAGIIAEEVQTAEEDCTAGGYAHEYA